MEAEPRAGERRIDDALPRRVQCSARCICGDSRSQECHKLVRRHGAIIGDIEYAFRRTRCSDRATDGTGHVSMMQHVQPLVRRPVPEPRNGFGQMWIAVAVHECEAKDSNIETTSLRTRDERRLGGGLAPRIRLFRVDGVGLARWAIGTSAVHQVRARENESLHAGGRCGVGKASRGAHVRRIHLGAGHSSERGRGVNDDINISDRADDRCVVSEIAGDRIDAVVTQGSCLIRRAHECAYGVAASHEPRRETRANAAGSAR